jgi:hypothetical protein
MKLTEPAPHAGVEGPAPAVGVAVLVFLQDSGCGGQRSGFRVSGTGSDSPLKFQEWS